MFAQIYPAHRRVGLAREKGIALRITARWRRRVVNQQAARAAPGFSSEFYGEAVLRTELLQTLDAYRLRGALLEAEVGHPAYTIGSAMGSAYCYPRLDEPMLISARWRGGGQSGVIVWEPTATCGPTGESGKNRLGHSAGFYHAGNRRRFFRLLADQTRWAVIR